MSTDIRELDPREVWRHFHSLTRIPRPSGHEEKVRAFIAGFGRSLGLDTTVDEAGNVIIRKPATSGMEEYRGIILQAHLDMVPQKNGGTLHDFETDPIEPIVDGGWVRARGTTLGADNGIGVAAAMAVLESGDLRHGPLEALFTSEEESGMAGALRLKPGMLKGGILLNLDSEDEGELFIGCAGGLDATMTFSYDEQVVPAGYEGYMLRVNGLRGGHSGMDIHLGRGNANKIMNRLLHQGYLRHGMLIGAIEGGTLRNAIPRESSALVVVPALQRDGFLDGLGRLGADIKNELASADPGVRIEAVSAALPELVIGEPVAERMLRAIHACPDGVMRMSCEMAGVVETSSNLAIVTSSDGEITVQCLLRSSVDSALEELATMIGSVFELAGAVAVFDGGYPGWKPDPGSPVLKGMLEIYHEKFGTTPEVKAVHAGLECGIIGSIYSEIDMISFGPTIRYPHSPDEKVEIASVEKFWDFLVETIGRVSSGSGGCGFIPAGRTHR
ncbi:MAG: aminoacyl-histidine dipeptidase [Chlorobium limicola]|uniref:Cytosol non-specific dipeptidase n=1 Tax=Chlorobium limicola (strain DSM 245 / NBRC 103803 / 6330) TaxID=290315 RepID=B3ECD6_CHLL2|nr:aminoacyl-histidine dipeptidase [Chlorobium limicola]ACD90211.1 aminoacyl-histidine dipeptidase [Chlorobium limicola DSM 245]NTV19966.1 aminoacyl-histidine dipeptidase [Chlorobium limicola]